MFFFVHNKYKNYFSRFAYSLILLLIIDTTICFAQTEDIKLIGSNNLTLYLTGMILLIFILLTGWLWKSGKSQVKETRLAKEKLAAKQLDIIKRNVMAYHNRKGEFPFDLRQVGLSPKLCVNPWGKAFSYQRKGNGFEILTKLPDNMEDNSCLFESWTQKTQNMFFLCGLKNRSN